MIETAVAPYRHDLAAGPAALAVWLRAEDGRRLRLGLWRASDKAEAQGVVLLLNGRGEYLEKYRQTAETLVQAGWHVLSLDWRGQGLSDRLAADPMLGHVGHFDEYQRDLRAVIAWLETAGAAYGLQGPRMLLAHSMGGLIGLRALYAGYDIKAAVFTAPMWGIRMKLRRQPSAAILSRLRWALRMDLHYAPDTGPESYVVAAPFAGNALTRSEPEWNHLRAQVVGEPGFGLGGPSIAWVRSALREARGLMAMKAPELPTLVALGGQEHLVLPGTIRRRLAQWPGSRLDLYPDARHEIAIERPEIRDLFLRRMLAFFGQHRG